MLLRSESRSLNFWYLFLTVQYNFPLFIISEYLNFFGNFSLLQGPKLLTRVLTFRQEIMFRNCPAIVSVSLNPCVASGVISSLPFIQVLESTLNTCLKCKVNGRVQRKQVDLISSWLSQAIEFWFHIFESLIQRYRYFAIMLPYKRTSEH
jgi:hypothetical protein